MFGGSSTESESDTEPEVSKSLPLECSVIAEPELESAAEWHKLFLAATKLKVRETDIASKSGPLSISPPPTEEQPQIENATGKLSLTTEPNSTELESDIAPENVPLRICPSPTDEIENLAAGLKKLLDKNAIQHLAGKLSPEPEQQPTVETQKPELPQESEISEKVEDSPLRLCPSPTDEIDVVQLAAGLNELLEKRGLQQTADAPIRTGPLDSPFKIRQKTRTTAKTAVKEQLPKSGTRNFLEKTESTKSSSAVPILPFESVGQKKTEFRKSSPRKSDDKSTPMRECRVILKSYNLKDSDFFKNSIKSNSSEEIWSNIRSKNMSPKPIPEIDGKS